MAPTRQLYFRDAAAYKACRINAFKPNERKKERESGLWRDIRNSKTLCTARGGRTR